MKFARFRSIDLDEEKQKKFAIPDLVGSLGEDFLHKKYIGLFTRLPTDSHPGIEVTGAGYQRQYFEPMNPNQRMEWAALSNWGEIVGFGVFNRHSATRHNGDEQDISLLVFIPTTFPMPIHKGDNLVAQYNEMQSSLKRGILPAAITKEPTFR